MGSVFLAIDTMEAIVIFVIAYVLIISEKVHRTIVGICGAVLMMAAEAVKITQGNLAATAMAVHPQRQCFQTAADDPTVEGR